MRRTLPILALCLSVLLNAEEKTRPFNNLSVEDGLPHTDVLALHQDRTGFMWIGTSSGLSQYDGVKIKTYNFANSGLLSNRISSLAEDPEADTLYIGTETGGLSVFDLNTKEVVENIPVPANHVHKILPVSKGEVWVGGEKGLSHVLFKEGGKDIVYLPFPNPLRNIKSFNEDLLLVFDNEISLFNPDTGIHFSIKTSGAHDALPVDLSHFLAATLEGTFLVDTRGGTKTLVDHSASRTLLRDSGGGILIGTVNEGLKHLNKDYTLDSAYPFKNEITSIYVDRSGLLWLGLISEGCYKKNNYADLFRYWSIGKSPLTMAADNKNRLWVSSRDGDLSVLDGETLRKLDPKTLSPFKGNPVSAIMMDSNGDLLLGSWLRGFGRIRANNVDRMASGRAVPMEIVMPEGDIYKFARDSHGGLWVSSSNGIWLFDKDRQTHFFNDGGRDSPVCDNFSTDILIDEQEGGREVWVGSSKGVSILKCSPSDSLLSFRHIKRSNDSYGLCGEFVSFIHKDRRGDIWVSTLGGGLNKFTRNTQSFSLYNTSNCPFPSDELESIVEDKSGLFWIGGPGLVAFNPENSEVRHYDKNDGLQSDVFKIWMSAEFPDGRICLGGLNGFNIFNPENIRPNTVAPDIVLTSLVVNGKERLPEELSEHRLAHSDNNLSFEFVALDFEKPHKNKYRYRLEGYETAWRETDGNNPVAQYLNLRPGNYAFVVWGSNGDGIWCESPRAVSFSIAPPLWRSNAAYVSYFIIFSILAAGLFISLRQRAIRNRQLEIERSLLRDQRKRNEQELNFHTEFAHEIKTPLTLIKAPAEELLRNKNLGKNTRERLGLIIQGSNIIQKQLDAVSDLRKYDFGQVELRVAKVDFGEFVKETTMMFLPVTMSRNIDFKTDIPEEPLWVYLDKDKIEKVILNILSNAVKYSPRQGGVIRVKVSRNESEALFSVSNLGIGIPPGEESSIFDRFKRGSNNQNPNGMGIGLAITKHAVESHKGSIKVDSIPGGETVFTVFLPLGDKHFDAAVIDRSNADADDLSKYDSLADLRPSGILPSATPERKYNIIVADDNRALLEYLRQMLSMYYNVTAVEDGQTCYERAMVDQPDLILTDIMMPGMSGVELCDRIKRNPDTSHIPVILLSARDLPTHKIEGYSTLADDYVTKPFHSDVLLSRISSLIALRESMRESFKTEISLDPSKITSTPTDERFIRRCVEDVESHLGEPEYGVNQLCLNIGVSRPQLYRKIKSITGMSATHFIRSIRIKRAAQMLGSDPNASISDIMFSVGFNNLSYFSKVFSAETGFLPKDYRKRML